MDPQVQAQLAVLIQKDMELLRARAGDDGVLAYGRKPVPREVPNGRFLQNTLRDLGSANRRAEEDTLWASRERQLDLQRPPRKRRCTPEPVPSQRASPDSRDPSPAAKRPWDEGEVATAELLSKRTVRGRGGVGPRAEEPGPFLPADEGFILEAVSAPVGPPRPAWLPREAQEPMPALLPCVRPSAVPTEESQHQEESKHRHKHKHHHKRKDKKEGKTKKSKKQKG